MRGESGPLLVPVNGSIVEFVWCLTFMRMRFLSLYGKNLHNATVRCAKQRAFTFFDTRQRVDDTDEDANSSVTLMNDLLSRCSLHTKPKESRERKEEIDIDLFDNFWSLWFEKSLDSPIFFATCWTSQLSNIPRKEQHEVQTLHYWTLDFWSSCSMPVASRKVSIGLVGRTCEVPNTPLPSSDLVIHSLRLVHCLVSLLALGLIEGINSCNKKSPAPSPKENFARHDWRKFSGDTKKLREYNIKDQEYWRGSSATHAQTLDTGRSRLLMYRRENCLPWKLIVSQNSLWNKDMNLRFSYTTAQLLSSTRNTASRSHAVSSTVPHQPPPVPYRRPSKNYSVLDPALVECCPCEKWRVHSALLPSLRAALPNARKAACTRLDSRQGSARDVPHK